MNKVSWVFGVLKAHGVVTRGMGVREAFEELSKLRKSGEITEYEAQPKENFDNGVNVGSKRKAEASPEDKTSIKEQVKKNLDKLNETKIVAVIKKGRITKDKEAARAALKGQMARTKGMVKRDGMGEVDVMHDVSTALSHLKTAAEVSSLMAVPAVIKNGIIIDEHWQHKGTNTHTVTIAARVNLADNPGIMAAVVKKNSKRYKTHAVLTPEGKTLWLDGEKAEYKKKNKH